MTRWKLEEDKNIVSRLNVFRQLLRKDQPMISDDNQLEISAIQAEIETCTAALRDYEAKITKGLENLNEVRNRIIQLQVEQVRILSTVPELQGVTNGN